jgi:GT2 family glycosyltransferase/glycosyltransferase involved in cell wall biosynthesis
MSTVAVDIIVPVHGAAAATRRCIASILDAPQTTAFELIVVDDASPDPDLVAYLQDLAADPRVLLLTQPTHQGYAAAVNRALAVHPDRDVVIVHSDAVVANDWLDRLAWHAQREPGTGLVAPFANRGAPAGYPHLEAPNPLPSFAELAKLDSLFARANPRQSAALPMVFGPCLYVRRECLASIGNFDASPLGTDWGVEIDLCLRAGSVGFRHYLAGDVCVGHAEHGSFGAEADALAARASESLANLYPSYPLQRTALRDRAHGRPFARRVDLLRLAEWPQPLIVFISHSWGGGIRRHMNDLAALARGRSEVLFLEPASDDTVKLYWPRPEEDFAAYFTLPGELPDLARLLTSLGVARLHYHHVHNLPRAILDLPAAAGLPYDCTLHDYYPICPQYHLVTADGRYCGEPAAAGCNACIAQRPHRWNLDIDAWRTAFEAFLRKADRVIAPSGDVAKRIDRYFPARVINVWPHPEAALPPPPRVARVVVLGNLSPEKGLRVVAACALDARLRGLPLTFRVLGSTTEPITQAPEVPLSIFGQYADAALPQLLAAEKPDVIFFPAQVPETYSYTLSVALASGVPIVASSLGAMAERLAGHAGSATIRWNALPNEWNAALQKAAGIESAPAAVPAAAQPLAVSR